MAAWLSTCTMQRNMLSSWTSLPLFWIGKYKHFTRITHLIYFKTWPCLWAFLPGSPPIDFQWQCCIFNQKDSNSHDPVPEQFSVSCLMRDPSSTMYLQQSVHNTSGSFVLPCLIVFWPKLKTSPSMQLLPSRPTATLKQMWMPQRRRQRQPDRGQARHLYW